MNAKHGASCPFADAILSAGEACGEAIEHAFNGARDIAATLGGVDDNPLGVVLIVYCRECECTHASHFEPDGPLGSSVLRAANACRVAGTTVRIATGERQTQHEQSSKKADAN